MGNRFSARPRAGGPIESDETPERVVVSAFDGSCCFFLPVHTLYWSHPRHSPVPPQLALRIRAAVWDSFLADVHRLNAVQFKWVVATAVWLCIFATLALVLLLLPPHPDLELAIRCALPSAAVLGSCVGVCFMLCIGRQLDRKAEFLLARHRPHFAASGLELSYASRPVDCRCRSLGHALRRREGLRKFMWFSIVIPRATPVAVGANPAIARSSCLIVVRVPPGKKTGDELKVTAPDGRVLRALVPATHVPGQSFVINATPLPADAEAPSTAATLPSAGLRSVPPVPLPGRGAIRV